jgi:hypothetical protein
VGPTSCTPRSARRGLDTGFAYAGAVGYHWARKDPNSLPVAPERIIQIADNVTQKGQSATGGGHWKIEHPMGLALCLFKGSVGRVPTLSPVAVNDSAWQRCLGIWLFRQREPPKGLRFVTCR